MSKFGNVVQEFYVERFHANMAERAGRLRGVTEPGQARAYIDDARRRFSCRNTPANRRRG